MKSNAWHTTFPTLTSSGEENNLKLFPKGKENMSFTKHNVHLFHLPLAASWLDTSTKHPQHPSDTNMTSFVPGQSWPLLD